MKKLWIVVAAALGMPSASFGAGKYALAYWREMAAYENQAPPAGEFGNHSGFVHVWDENGAPLAGKQIYTSWGVLLGATDANGYVEIILNRPNGYDFQVRDGSHATDTTPVLSVERAPSWGHYSFELGFMFKGNAANPGIFDATHVGTINASGADPCQHLSAPHTKSLAFYSTYPSNYCSDQYALGNWAGSHGQTFIATGNRIIGMKAHMAAGLGEHYNWTVQIFEDGPGGTPIGPPRTTRTVVDSEYNQIVVKWGVNDVQVTPGRTYYMRITRDVGINVYRVIQNTYNGGSYFENDVAMPGLELMGAAICATYTNSGPVGTLTGFVRQTNNVGIRGALVAIGSLYAATAANGSYTIPYVPAGTYNVTASKTGYISAQNSGVTISPGQTTASSFVLTAQSAANGAIAGVVRDIRSNVLSGVRLTAYPSGVNAVSSTDGTYQLSLPFGSYRVVASKANFASEVVSSILVTNGQTTARDFVMGPQPLVNANFESGFTGSVGNGWKTFRLGGGAAYIEESANKLGGARSQRWWTSFVTHDAGIFQQVPAVLNGSYSFSAWTWRSDQWNNGSNNEEMWVGVDPFGGTNAGSANVVWSSSQFSYRTWTRQTAAVQARANTITVFVRGKANFAGDAMLAVVDDAVLAGPAAFPLGLAAVAGNERVDLSWYASSPSNLKRSLTGNGPFVTIAPGLSVNTFTDTDVTNGVTYYYVVSAGTDSPPVSATPTAAIALVPSGSTWRFLDNGSNQGSAWRGTNFNDTAWKSGPARLGYGGDGEATLVVSNANPTVYFRHSFVVSNAATYTNLLVRLLRDDGGIVYLNETEVFRSNMPADPITHLSYASTSVGGADEFAYFSTNVAPDLLREGANMLAVEVHQVNATSSDLGFDLELIGTASALPRLMITRLGELLELSWPASAAGFDLESSTNPSGQWEFATNGVNAITIQSSDSQRFYRLRK